MPLAGPAVPTYLQLVVCASPIFSLPVVNFEIESRWVRASFSRLVIMNPYISNQFFTSTLNQIKP